MSISLGVNIMGINKRNHKLTCQKCGNIFLGYRPSDKFCSSKCSNSSERKYETVRKFQQKRRQFLNDYKLEKGCTDCGFKEHPAALHFDHVKGEKKFNVSQDPKRSMEDLLVEIEKCEVVCANCHSIRTSERGQYRGSNHRSRSERLRSYTDTCGGV